MQEQFCKGEILPMKNQQFLYAIIENSKKQQNNDPSRQEFHLLKYFVRRDSGGGQSANGSASTVEQFKNLDVYSVFPADHSKWQPRVAAQANALGENAQEPAQPDA